ncbi:MAG: Outer membrane lipoprotein omp16 precursor [uncultured Aureispira sp.]|uniref:Outer membrane lipoprotein omp16 n=1 Tax=uncultured Aureispira sp. TaxID=1331704 RepID=A0A6S6ULW8_9BACT|nr:MAG: Outer membrane lipoprotein omp16 precursor [uncultured Aureispira sp.]
MKYLALFIVLLFTQTQIVAQSPSKIKKEAEKLLSEGKYQKSLTEYNKIKEKYVKDINLKYNIGLCYYHLNNMKEAIVYFKFHGEQANKPIAKTYYYLARAHHAKNDFRAAALYYKNHLRTLSSDDPKRAHFKRLIIQCMSGPKVEQINSAAIVSTLGVEINSAYDDYRICFNPRVPHTLFFSSKRSIATGGKLNNQNQSDLVNGSYRSDIYKSTLEQGTWKQPQALSKRYNSIMSEDIIGFFDNGYQMLLLKGFSDGHKAVVKENYDEDSIEVILPFANTIHSTHWDGDHFFINDSSIIFASDRPGGYGGRDLYYAIQKNSIWQVPNNLGPAVNTEQDEASPFLAKDGRTLYFSSDGPSSMGGYDIYKTFFKDSTRTWQKAENLGVPINSAAHDKDFFLDEGGLKAYFCSDRIEGLGGFDLYSAYFRSPKQEQLQKTNALNFIEVLNIITDFVDDSSSNTIQELTPVENGGSITNDEEKTIYNIAPIYYNAETGKIEGSRNTILALKKLLVKHPETTILLSTHSDNSGNEINDLYLSIKQSEDLSKELIESGAQNKQIWIRGCGQNYPIANNQNFDGSPNPIASKMNRRINIEVYNINHLKDQVLIHMIAPKVSSVMQNKAYERYQTLLKGLSYKVQVTQTSTLFNHSIFTQFPHATTEKHPQDVRVKYMLGLEKTFEQTKRIFDQIVQQGFSDAKIIPYVNGIRMTENQVQALLTEYPDLKKFLAFRSH